MLQIVTNKKFHNSLKHIEVTNIHLITSYTHKRGKKEIYIDIHVIYTIVCLFICNQCNFLQSIITQRVTDINNCNFICNIL